MFGVIWILTVFYVKLINEVRKMSHNEFDKRMKSYEAIFCQKIVPHFPTILRIDGKCFHNFTKGCERPFDHVLMEGMIKATMAVYDEFHYRLAYGQSDEVSILIYHPDTITQEDFQGKVFKLCSIASSVFTAHFNKYWSEKGRHDKIAYFDCRVFQMPEEEVVNYFIWRQKDAVRNSIQMLGQANFSHKELHGCSCSQIQDKLMLEKGINWNDLGVYDKQGWCVDKRKYTDYYIPKFTENREYIQKYLKEEIDG